MDADSVYAVNLQTELRHAFTLSASTPSTTHTQLLLLELLPVRQPEGVELLPRRPGDVAVLL